MPSSTGKKYTSANIRARDEKNENSTKFMLECLNTKLLEYSVEERETASKMDDGFTAAMADTYLEMNDMEDLDMEDKDEAFNKLYQNIVTLPEFCGIQSRLVAIILAKFFLENFKYLPTPSIPLIECRDIAKTSANPSARRVAETNGKYIPISLPQHKSISMHAHGMPQAKKDSSRLSDNNKQILTKPYTSTSNQLKGSSASTLITSSAICKDKKTKHS